MIGCSDWTRQPSAARQATPLAQKPQALACPFKRIGVLVAIRFLAVVASLRAAFCADFVLAEICFTAAGFLRALRDLIFFVGRPLSACAAITPAPNAININN